MSEIFSNMADNWVYWFVAVFAVVAAYIDGKELRVPNKLTFPMIVAGWVYSCVAYGIAGDGWYYGLMWSMAGTFVGMMTLLPFYSIGGMGAGDVKMMMGIGAWLHVTVVFYSFCVGAIVGAIMAVIMIVMSGQWRKHFDQGIYIFNEIIMIRDPEALSEIAAQRKPSMKLLPYGIPMCIGTLMYMGWMGLLV